MSDRSLPTSDPTVPTRRTVLRAAGLAALTGGGLAVLGACTADGETGTPASSAPATSASSAPASSSAPATTPSASAGKQVGLGKQARRAERSQRGHVQGAGRRGRDPGRRGLRDHPAQKGTYKAFSKICTHQRCPVTSVEGGTINCRATAASSRSRTAVCRTAPPPSRCPRRRSRSRGKRWSSPPDLASAYEMCDCDDCRPRPAHLVSQPHTFRRRPPGSWPAARPPAPARFAGLS